MQITYHFRSAADWSDSQRGNALIRVLSNNGLTVDRFGCTDPPRLPFDPLAIRWTESGLPGLHSAGDFHFRGSGTGNFKGTAAWNRNLPPGTKHFNALVLSLTVRRQMAPSWLIDLGDQLFDWARPVFGRIAVGTAIGPTGSVAGNLFLPGLAWVNYFALPAYADLPLTDEANPIRLPLGVRVVLTDHPEDREIGPRADSLKAAIGPEWFENGTPDARMLPAVDFSALWRHDGQR